MLPTVRTLQRPLGSMVLRERQVIASVTLADGVRVGGGGEALARVGADRFQHPEPRPRVHLLSTDDEALADQAVERV